MQSALARHISVKHREEPDVKKALKLSAKKRHEAFKILRLQGMDKFNSQLMKEGKDEKEYLRVRNQGDVNNGDLCVCDSCSGLFLRKHFYSHKKKCFEGASVQVVNGIPLETMKEDSSFPELWQDVINNMVKDEVSSLVKQDDMIKRVGQYEYDRLKKDPAKRSTMKNRVSTIMRRLANLSLYFKQVASGTNEYKHSDITTNDLLDASKFYLLESAMELYVQTAATKTQKEDDSVNEESNSLKVGIGFMLKKCATVMRAHYFIKYGREKAREIDDFSSVLTARWPAVFSASEFKIQEKRATTLRKPAVLPKEEDVHQMRSFNVSRLKELSDEYALWTDKEFVEARDLVVSRLTFFNARRGNEPSKLLLSEIQDALTSAWITDSSNVGIKHKLAYQRGKGNALVPTLIPEECMPLIKKLVSMEVRNSVGVHADNIFAFPSTRNSLSSCSGWHAVDMVRKVAGVTSRLNATKMRHRASTKFQTMNKDDSVKQAFYDHMGHAPEINKHVYASPAAEKEVKEIAQVMETIDKPAGSV